jgi:hypothetical protein
VIGIGAILSYLNLPAVWYVAKNDKKTRKSCWVRGGVQTCSRFLFKGGLLKFGICMALSKFE